jgi:hypothetical protein
VQRATAQSKTGIFRDFGVAEAPPGFQASWSDCMYCFSLSLCSSFLLIWEVKSSQVKLLITDNAFCIVQRAIAQSKTGIFRDYCVAEAPSGFQAGWSDCMYCFSLSFCSFCLLIWVFRVSFCTHEGTLPYRSFAQMSCRGWSVSTSMSFQDQDQDTRLRMPNK